MIKNYLLIAYRNLLRNKLYSLINILGLAIGIAAFLLISLYVLDESGYDTFHAKAKRIYRVCERIDNTEGQGENSSSCPFPVGPTLLNDYPQYIEQVVRFFNFQDPQHTITFGDKKINEKNIFFVDSTVFKVFDFKLKSGNAEDILAKPSSIIMTEEMARRYFGNSDPIGRIIKFDGTTDLMVTGILDKVPAQSHFQFDALVSFSTVKKILGGNQQKNWIWNPCWTYLLLKEGVTPKDLEKEFPAYVNKYFPDFIKTQIVKYLQPLTDIHLTSKLDYEMKANGDKDTLYILSLIGVFILIVASINFMNLATARSAGRSKEVGIRKVVGSYRIQLIQQFLTESVLLTFIALVCSLVFVEVLLPLFNSIAGKTIKLNLLQYPVLIFVILGTGVITGIVSGIYPAFYLSSFNPVKVLKGSTKGSKPNAVLRKSLVVVQFSISIGLIISTAVIYFQNRYLQNASPGFDKEDVMLIPVRPPMAKAYFPFIESLKGQKNISGVATMNDVLGVHHNTHEYNYESMQPGKWIYFPSLLVNEDFVNTFKMKLLAGRNFSKDYTTDDTLGVIINEAMVKHLNWSSPQAAIGKQFYTPSGREKVIGVVSDFNFVSLNNPIGPFVLDMPHRKLKIFWTRFIAIRIAAQHRDETISFIEGKWNEFSKDYPFDYTFIDQHLSRQYKAQANLAKLTGYFTILAIFIACLGLFALASYTAEQRTKEIGIRKVLGASVKNIVYLITKDFLKLIMIANLIAIPLSYLIMQRWLQGFAYRINLDWEIFAGAALLIMIIALSTITVKAIRAALQYPVDALRYE